MTKIKDKAENYKLWICRDGNGARYLYRTLRAPTKSPCGAHWLWAVRGGKNSRYIYLPASVGDFLAPLQPGGGPVKVKLVKDEET